MELDDGFDEVLQLIALECPTNMTGLMAVEGFNEEYYDAFGQEIKKVTVKYKKKASKATQGLPDAAPSQGRVKHERAAKAGQRSQPIDITSSRSTSGASMKSEAARKTR